MIILLFILISLVFFLRGDIPFFHIGISPSQFIPIFTIVVLALQIITQRIRLGFQFYSMLIVFCVFSISIIINLFIVPEEVDRLVTFFAEITLNFLLYFVAYNMFFEANLKRLSKLHFISGIIFSLPVVIIALSLEKVRRIGAGGDEEAALPVAVNHIGHSLTLTIIFGVVFYLLTKKELKGKIGILIFAGLGVMCLSMLLTGSKAGLIGMLFFSVMFSYKWINKNSLIIILPLLLIIGIFIFPDVDVSKYEGLFDRFTMDRFFVALDQRTESLQVALESAQDGIQLLGYPWRYQLLNLESPIRYPHNFYVSILLHLGVYSCLAFSIYTIFTCFRLFRISLNRNDLLAKLLLAMFVTVLVYVITSGRLTRVMTIFWIFGIVDAYLDHFRKNDSLY